MPKVDDHVYLTLPKGLKPPTGYVKSKNVGNEVLYKKKVSVDMFSALDMKKMINRNISKSKGGKRTKKVRRKRANHTRRRKH